MNIQQQPTGDAALVNIEQQADEQQAQQDPSSSSHNNEADNKFDYRVTLLDENNYITWKWQIQMILKCKGLLETVTKDKGNEIQKSTAATFLASTLSQDNMRRVINCDTAHKIWTTLEANFENKSPTERAMLLEKLTSARIHSIRSIGKDIGEIQALAANLKNMGAKIDDELIISIILKGLPEGMNAWKSTWKLVNANEPSLNNLISSIHAEVSEMRNFENVALVAREQPSMETEEAHRFLSRFDKQTQPCYDCNQLGHWYAECPKNKKKVARKNKLGDGKSYIAL